MVIYIVYWINIYSGSYKTSHNRTHHKSSIYIHQTTVPFFMTFMKEHESSLNQIKMPSKVTRYLQICGRQLQIIIWILSTKRCWRHVQHPQFTQYTKRISQGFLKIVLSETLFLQVLFVVLRTHSLSVNSFGFLHQEPNSIDSYSSTLWSTYMNVKSMQ